MSEFITDRDGSATMGDKLFGICEMQLLSIIKDAEISILKMTNSTKQAVVECAELSAAIEASNSDRKAEIDLSSNLQSNVSSIFVNMQFFDELSQRIEHIMEIVNLIREESGREGFLSDPRESKELFNNIRGIFSIRSEFEVMRSIFPEYNEIEYSQAIEIF